MDNVHPAGCNCKIYYTKYSKILKIVYSFRLLIVAIIIEE